MHFVLQLFALTVAGRRQGGKWKISPLPSPVIPKARPYAGNDVFYSKGTLKKLAALGYDLSGMKHFQSSPRFRALVDHEHWFETKRFDGETKVIMPWAFHSAFPEQDKVRGIVAKMNRDLGCVSNHEVTNTANTEHEFGVLLVWGDRTGGGCWTTTGIAPGFVGDSGLSIGDLGVPATWQIMSLSQECDGTSEATVMHEFIHAWGFQHEHARPDRSSYITVNLDNTDNDEQFVTLDGGSWRDSDFPYETQSVMHYCSTCGTNGKGPVMTYHDGSFFDSGQFMTTTDALQIQWSYCREKEEFVYKDHLNCSSVDRFGYTRPVFRDRICDGRADCPNSEDENGILATCIPSQPETENGCCSLLLLDDDRCAFRQTWFGRDFYRCESNTEKVVFFFDGTWYLGLSGIPDVRNPFQYAARVHSNSTCPPFTTWSDGPLNVRVFCESKGADFDAENVCEEADCDINAECSVVDGLASCICKMGYTGDGNTCETIELVDECFENKHDCHANATCIDNDTSFTCQCNDGFEEEDSSPERPGRRCVPTAECCQVFTIGVPNHDQYNAICIYNRTQLNGFLDYQCIANPLYPSHWWQFPMSVQYANILLHEYFLQTGSLTAETNTVWSNIWDRQEVPFNSIKKCPIVETVGSATKGGWRTMKTMCLKHFDKPVMSPCLTGQHSCDVNAHCEQIDTLGNYKCNCKIGFTKPPNGQFCIALVDECSSGLHECDEKAFCFDRADGYGCMCDEGYSGNGFSCVELDHCQMASCLDGFECVNGPQGAECVDKDECEDGIHQCGDDERCDNAIGSFHCVANTTTTAITTTTVSSTTTKTAVSTSATTTTVSSTTTKTAVSTSTTTAVSATTTPITTSRTTRITTTSTTTTATRTTTTTSTTSTMTTTITSTILSTSTTIRTTTSTTTDATTSNTDQEHTNTPSNTTSTLTTTTTTPMEETTEMWSTTEAFDEIDSECVWPTNSLTTEEWARFKQTNSRDQSGKVVARVMRFCPVICAWGSKECFDYETRDTFTCITQANRDGDEFKFWTKEPDAEFPRDSFFGGRQHQNPRRFGTKAMCSPTIVIQNETIACGSVPTIPPEFRPWSAYDESERTVKCINGGDKIKDTKDLDLVCMKKKRWDRPEWVTRISRARFRRTTSILKRKYLCREPKNRTN